MELEAAQLANEVAKESLLGSFGVSWRLFIAQLVNFSVVLFVLWKWVFNPAIKALDERQKTIAKGLDDAAKAADDRSKAGEEKEALILTARSEAHRILELAAVDAEKLRKETSQKTQSEIADLVAKGKLKLEEEKEKIVLDAKSEIADLVIASTEKVLSETSSDKRERSLIDAAVRNLIG